MASENLSTAAIILASISILCVLFLGWQLYDNQPQEADLSQVEGDIVSLKSDMRNLQYEVASIDKDNSCSCDIDKNDLYDLEEELKDYVDDEIDDECDCDEGKVEECWDDNSNLLDFIDCLGFSTTI